MMNLSNGVPQCRLCVSEERLGEPAELVDGLCRRHHAERKAGRAHTQAVMTVASVVHVETVTPSVRRITLVSRDLARLGEIWRPEQLITMFFPPDEVAPERLVNAASTFTFPAGLDVPFRQYTGRSFDPATGELRIDFVLHDAPGPGADWAKAARPGTRVALFAPDSATSTLKDPPTTFAADSYLLVADESATPAAATVIEAMPPGTRAIALLEVSDASEHQAFTLHADVDIRWIHRGPHEPGTAGVLQAAVRELRWPAGQVYAWVCGEIGMVNDIRMQFRERGLRRDDYTVRAYWRRGIPSGGRTRAH